MSMNNSNDTIGNRTRDLPVCSAVPQPTAPPAACPLVEVVALLMYIHLLFKYLPRSVTNAHNIFLYAILRRSWLTTLVAYKTVHLPPTALQPLLDPRPLSKDTFILLTLLLVFCVHVFLGSLRNHILHFRNLNSSDVCLWHPICLNMAGIFL